MRKATRKEVADLIRNTKGKMFSVEFVKKDGTLRKMNARMGVKKHLKGGESTIAGKENLIGCYDMQTGGYRCINVDTLLKAKVDHEEYDVTDTE